MKKTKLRFATSILLLASLLLGGVSCRRGGDLAAQRAYRQINLEYWTVFHSPEDFQQIIADYRAIHPNIRVEVKKFRFEEYENQLLNALAEDRGPDIFSLHNTWIPEYRTKLLPLPAQTTLAYQVATGTVKKELITELRTTNSLNVAGLQRQFLAQVYEDVYLPELTISGGQVQIGENKIYGLPLAFDTMVLYYNRDLLDNAGVAEPARTWQEFQQHVTSLARFDSQGRILTAGAALGTAENTTRPTDILSLLMMQNGAQMFDKDGRRVNFHTIPDNLRGVRNTIPGEDALRFYTSFANPNNQNYTWNEQQSDAFESFLQGRVAYFFGYAYHQEQIRGLAPRLNFGVSTMPQIQNNPEMYFANYWVETVSRKTENADAAWDFLQFITSSQESQKFLASAKLPTARRDLVNAQLEDPELYVFANQLLRSSSWYNGQDAAAMEAIMKELVKDALAGTQDLDDLLKLAAERVQQTYRIE